MKILMCFSTPSYVSPFRLEFESHCARLNAQLEYEQNQLEQLKKKLHKMEECIEEEERTVAERRKVIISGFPLSVHFLAYFQVLNSSLPQS